VRTGYVVLTYNRPGALLAVLRALAPQCGADDVVVIADDGSKPEHVAALRAGLPRFAAPVLHVWRPDVGFTAARSRNLGAACARADYLVFLDGDCVPNPRFARQHARLAEPGCFVNGSRVLLSERLTGRALAGKVELGALGAGDWLRLRLAGDANRLSQLVAWPGAPLRRQRHFRWKGIRSCNFALAWKDFEACNGFDEVYAGWGHEDADLVLRLHHLGLARKNGFLGTEVYHLWHPEHSRAGEAANRQRVADRAKTGIIRAEAGLAEAIDTTDTVVTELNR
jgi:GT2 family glycosyltransferase